MLIILIVATAMIGLTVPIEFAEARSPDEPCSYNKSNSYLKISNEPWTCQKVNYWVPEKCGIIEGLHKTDPACQAPKGLTDKELQDQREQQEQREREQREREQEQKQYDREQEQKQQQQQQQQQQTSTASSLTGGSESVTAYYIGTIFGEVIFIVLVPVSIAYVIVRLRFGGKKND